MSVTKPNASQAPLTLAIDIGGTAIKMLVMDVQGERNNPLY